MIIELKDKISLITGAGRGIGESICIDLAQAGSKVVAISRNGKNLNSIKKKIPGNNHLFFSLDLEKKNSSKILLKYLKKNKIKPDIVVNNVGGNLGYTDPLAPMSDFEKVFHLNFKLAVEINRNLIPSMVKKKWGRIINISSISALENQGPPAYCAAKAALNAYTRSLGRFVSKDNVIMTTVMPGAIMTNGGYWEIKSKTDKKHVSRYLKDRMAINRFGKVSEISSFVTFLASDHASFCPGSGFLVDGGQGRLFYNGE